MRSEQIAEATGNGEDVLGRLFTEMNVPTGKPGNAVRATCELSNVAKVEHALDANHPVPCELIVATDLGAADEVAIPSLAP